MSVGNCEPQLNKFLAYMLRHAFPFNFITHHVFESTAVQSIMEKAAEIMPKQEIPNDGLFEWCLVSGDLIFGIGPRNVIKEGVKVLTCFGNVRLKHTMPFIPYRCICLPDSRFVVDYSQNASLFYFVRPSCVPNCHLEFVWNGKECYPILVTNREIIPGENLTLDFNFSITPGTKNIVCHCGMGTNCRTSLAYVQNTFERYKCKYCKRCFSSSNQLYQHVLIKELCGGRLPCQYKNCKKSFTHMASYYTHLKRKHNKPGETRLPIFNYECSTCNEVITGPQRYLRHADECAKSLKISQSNGDCSMDKSNQDLNPLMVCETVYSNEKDTCEEVV